MKFLVPRDRPGNKKSHEIPGIGCGSAPLARASFAGAPRSARPPAPGLRRQAPLTGGRLPVFNSWNYKELPMDFLEFLNFFEAF